MYSKHDMPHSSQINWASLQARRRHHVASTLLAQRPREARWMSQNANVAS